jgi:hypothetical protein
MQIDACPSPHWIPVKLAEVHGEPVCHWLYVEDKRFTQPFFSDTIQACRSLPDNTGFRDHIASLSLLPEWSMDLDTTGPDLFIFHISRCGSTLASQLLSLDPENIVFSEAPLLDEILRLPFHHLLKERFADTDQYFKAALKFYGRKTKGNEKRLIIKTDSWHLMFYPQLRRLYPQTPFIIIIRAPDEVIGSQHKLRGMHSVPGLIEPELLRLPANHFTSDFDLYMATVLESYFRMILQMKDDPLCHLVDYNSGMDRIMQKIFEVTAMNVPYALNEKMRERLRFHGKSPHEVFSEEALMADVRGYMSHCFELYRQLGGVKSGEGLPHS